MSADMSVKHEGYLPCQSFVDLDYNIQRVQTGSTLYIAKAVAWRRFKHTFLLAENTNTGNGNRPVYDLVCIARDEVTGEVRKKVREEDISIDDVDFIVIHFLRQTELWPIQHPVAACPAGRDNTYHVTLN